MKKLLLLGLVCAICLSASPHRGYAQTALRRTVVDSAERKVSVPRIITRIVITCYGGASHEISVLGGADKIVAQPSVRRFPQLVKMYPQFKAVPDAGSFDAVNIEHIMVLKPDIVVAGITSIQGNKKIEATGIPVVVAAIGHADIEGLFKEFRMMGEILGAERIAEELVGFWKDRLSLIRRRVAAMPEKTRKKVFYVSSGSSFNTEGRLWWGHHFITASGGVNVAKDVGLARQVAAEQLLVWNPEVIITQGSAGMRSSAGAIRANPQLRNVKAVRENAVYRCPVGAFWWDRPSPEAILGIMWLAKTLYPSAFTDTDLKGETDSFFRRFYGYNLSDEEYEAFGTDGHDE